MLIVNFQKLEASASNPDHPMHAYWDDVERGKKAIEKRFPSGQINFVNPHADKWVDYIDAKGNEVKALAPCPPTSIPLKTEFSHPSRGREIWACAVDTPSLLRDNMGWDLGRTKRKHVEERLVVDWKKDIDLAYYLLNISNIVKSGQLAVEDLKADAKKKGDAERENLDRKFAIWKQLDDEKTVRMAKWLGLPNADNDDPESLRFEIENRLKANDDKALRDPAVRGTTKEFMEAMKPDDGVRARVFLRECLDQSWIVWKPDGTYRVGDTVLIHINKSDLDRKFDKLCDFMGATAHVEDLRTLMRNVVTKDYLDKISDNAEFRWIAKVMEIEGYYNKKEDEVKQMVYAEFNLD